MRKQKSSRLFPIFLQILPIHFSSSLEEKIQGLKATHPNYKSNDFSFETFLAGFFSPYTYNINPFIKKVKYFLINFLIFLISGINKKTHSNL